MSEVKKVFFRASQSRFEWMSQPRDRRLERHQNGRA